MIAAPNISILTMRTCSLADLLSSVNTWTQNQVFNGTNNTMPNHAGLPPSLSTVLTARQLAFETALQELCTFQLNPLYAMGYAANGGEYFINAASNNGIRLHPNTSAGGKAKFKYRGIAGTDNGIFTVAGYKTILGIRFVFNSWNPATSQESIRMIFGDDSAADSAIPNYTDPLLSSPGFGLEIRNNESNSAIQMRIFSRGSDNNIVTSEFIPTGVGTNFYLYPHQVLLEYDSTTGEVQLFHTTTAFRWAQPSRTPKIVLPNNALKASSTSFGGTSVTAAVTTNPDYPLVAGYEGYLYIQKMFIVHAPI